MSEKVPHLFLPFRGDYPITQLFGGNEEVAGALVKHQGVDYGLPCGTPVYAAMSGIVTSVVPDDRRTGYGWYIKITYGDVTTLYAHLSKMYVRQGQSIKAGEPIGLSGNSGFVTGKTGCHLHFGLSYKGIYIDPLPFMTNGNIEPRVIPEPSDKKVAVLRLYNPDTKDHFYTTDGAEADNAIRTLGYVFEGVLGYVYGTV